MPVPLISGLAHVAPLPAVPLPPVETASFGIPDTLFLVVLALVVFGPKKLPEISRQVGKLLYEFRKASNDFKFQIEEELRTAEQAEREKELAAGRRDLRPAAPVAISATETVSAEPAALPDEPLRAPVPGSESVPAPPPGAKGTLLQPPATGEPVSGRRPYRAAETPAADASAADVPSADVPSADVPWNSPGPDAAAADLAGAPPSAPLTPEQAEQLEELRAEAEDAMKAVAAESASMAAGEGHAASSLPTHHG